MIRDYSKLNGKIVEKCGTQAVFAKKINLSEATVSKLLNGNAEWRQNQIEMAANILDISIEDVPIYFFKKKLSST